MYIALTRGGCRRHRLKPENLFSFILSSSFYRNLALGITDMPERVSFLHFLFLCQTGGGLVDAILGFNSGYRVKEGTTAAARLVAGQLGSDKILLGEAVEHVRYGGSGNGSGHGNGNGNNEKNDAAAAAAAAAAAGENRKAAPPPVAGAARTTTAAAHPITVRTRAGTVLRAKRLLLTGSPVGLRRILFEPPLPMAKRRLLDSMYMGVGARYNIIYDQGPFWYQLGFTGAIGDGVASSPVIYAYDVTPPSGAPGVMQFWLVGHGAAQVEAMAEQARANYLADYLVPFFGPEARNFSGVSYVDFTADPYIGGGFSGSFPPGVWTQYAAAAGGLNATVGGSSGSSGSGGSGGGLISWAGAEWTTRRFSYVEGAIRTGAEAAAAAIEALRPAASAS